MLKSLFGLLLFLCVAKCAYTPYIYGITHNVIQRLALYNGEKATSLLVAASGGSAHIFDIIRACRTQEDEDRDEYECAESITASAFAMGISVLAYRKEGFWSKRDLTSVEELFALIPDHIEISNVKLHGQPVEAAAISRMRKRDLESTTQDPVSVLYNGSLPLTFLLHQPINGSNTTVPIFHATDGSHAQIHHIIPLNQTGLHRRVGFNGYTHIGAGGLKVQSNSDTTAAWNDVMTWLNYGGGNTPPMSIILDMEKESYMMGHAFTTKVGGFKDGQFAMEEESNGFGNNFEDDWNWCWGAYPTNCNSA